MSTLGVSLWEVVEARGGPLTEIEIWAILAATVTTIQDTTLSGEGSTGVITPEGLVLRRCGRVDLISTLAHSSAHPHGNYLPPETFSNQLEHNHERTVVFSLGRTLWAVTEYGSTSVKSSDSSCGKISSSLRSTLAAMTHNLPAHRLTLVDIFQLLVERLDGHDRLNYTATIRSLYEEVLGPPIPPPQPPDHFMRERSYSALDAKTSSARRLSIHSWNSRRATSVENLHHPQLSLEQHPLEPLNPLYMGRSPSTHISHTPRGRAVIRMASMQDVSLLSHSLPQTNRLEDDGMQNLNCHRSLWKSKMNFRSVDTLCSTKENIQPNGYEGRRMSFLGGTMNPIQETSPLKSLPGQGSHEIRTTVVNSQSTDSCTAVTVSRSATVAGDIKDQRFEPLCIPGFQKRIPPKKPPRTRAMSVDNLLNAEAELRQNQNEEVPTKRRMVVRTPSRLYRFANNSLNVVKGKSDVPAIIGPEFVVRSKEPVVHLSLVNSAQIQRGVVKRVTVVLVTGRRIELTCDPTIARVSQVLQAVLEEERLPIPHLLGLAVLGGGEFHFVAPQTKLHKVAPPGWKERHPTKDGLIQDNFTLHLRIIYYLKFNNVQEMDRASRQLLFLQLRHDMLEGRLPVPPNILLQLAPLALQAEFGDQREQDIGYFLPEHYVSESLLRGGQASRVSEELHQQHAALAGRHYTVAQTQFINIVQDTLHYGTHFYHVTQDKGRQQCWLGIGRDGVLVVGNGPPSPETLTHAALHPWPSIKRLSYASHRLTIAVRGPDKTTKIKFNLQENRSRHVFYLATVHQSFHRDASATPAVAPAQAPAPAPFRLGAPLNAEVSSLPDIQHRAPSSASSVATTARTSLSSAGTGDELHSCGKPEGAVAAEEDHGTEKLASGPTSLRSLNSAVSVETQSSEVLSRANFLSNILWRGGGDESDEVFSIDNLENEQQNFHLQKQQKGQQEDPESLEKLSVPRIFHQRSKSNVENSSLGIKGAGGIRPELSREFGSDESLLKSPTKGTTVRMGTRVSAAALQKHRMRSLEGLVQLPSLEELNTSPEAVVVEPSIRSVVVEESVSESLLERFSKCPEAAGPERRLQTVTLVKKDGSLGVMIAEGVDHGIYIQAVSPGGPAAEQGHLKPGDRIVGINGRSVENLPYTGAVELLRRIDSEVTLLVSQPVTPSASNTPTSAPAPPTDPKDTRRRRPPPPPNGNTTIGDSAGHINCTVKDCEGKGERGCARVQAVGGARTFIREVRSGPVTVITVNTDPSVLDDVGKSPSTHTTPTHSGSLKQAEHITKLRPSPNHPRQSLASSSSNSSVAPVESKSRLKHSAVHHRPSLYRAELVQNDSYDNFSTYSSMESVETMRSHTQQQPAALSKDTNPFSFNPLCTTDNNRWIFSADKNKRYKH